MPSRILLTTTAPSCPALEAIFRAGSSSARRTISTPSPALAAQLQLLERGQAADVGHAAAGDDALLHRGAGGVQRVLDPGLLLLHLGLGGRADVDHRHAADQLGQPLLELLAVVVGGGLLDLRADLLDAALDVGLLAGAVDERGVVLVDDDPLGAAEVLQRQRSRA